MNIEESSTTTPLLDLLFNMLLMFFCFWVLAMVNMKKDETKAQVQTKAEFVITVTWPLDNPDDVDTWLQDPLGNVVFYRNKERGLMHIDRDDLGSRNDTIRLPDGTVIQYPYNQEITTIRGFIPGEWILNAHLYAKHQPNDTVVTIKMEKLNPVVKTVLFKNITLRERWDEVTVGRFEMTGGGDILNWDYTPKKLVQVGQS